jgi:hypothetical protein
MNGAPDGARTRAIRALGERLADRREELARRVVECLRQEIVDYRAPSDGRALDEEFCVVAQNVVLSVARPDVPHEREAALEIAGRISKLADRVATACMGAFLDEVAGRGLLRRDLLDALLTAKGDESEILRLARMSHLRLAASYVVVVVRGEGVKLTAAREQSPAVRRTLDRIVEEIRRHMRPSAGSLLVGIRNGSLVVLFPAAGPILTPSGISANRSRQRSTRMSASA